MIFGAVVLGLLFAVFFARFIDARRSGGRAAFRPNQSRAGLSEHGSPSGDIGMGSVLLHYHAASDASAHSGHHATHSHDHGAGMHSDAGHDCSCDSSCGCDGGVDGGGSSD